MGRKLNLTGRVFSRLTVLSEAPIKAHKTRWNCRCSCGRELVTTGAQLVYGSTGSCGCLQRDRAREASSLDLVGRRFGRLLVLSRTKRGRLVFWECVCDCGNKKAICTGNLHGGHTQSCGCLQREAAATVNLKHGLTRSGQHHPLYRIWWTMIQRCENPNERRYARYGGRGITVCERWRGDFTAFLSDMGPRPVGMTLEREDNNKGYNPDNCTWATREAQARNRHTTRFLEHDGRTLCMKEWAKELGVSNSTTLLRWLKDGYSLAELFKLKVAGVFPLKKGENRPRKSLTKPASG
jgi:hypothetical protein